MVYFVSKGKPIVCFFAFSKTFCPEIYNKKLISKHGIHCEKFTLLQNKCQ